MNYRSLFALLLLFIFSQISYGAAPDIFVSQEAGFAVMVNGEVIPAVRYNRAASMILKELEKSGEVDLNSENGKEVLKLSLRSAVDEIIDSLLTAHGAASLEVKAGSDEIRRRIDEVKEGFPSSHEFHKSLAQQGISADLLAADIKKQVVREKIIAKLESQIKINDGEISEFYYRNNDLFVQPERIHIRTITVNSKADAEGIEKYLKDGIDFVQAAKTYSVDKNAKDGGDIGYVEKSDLPSGVWDVISKLKPGEVSPIIRTITAYQIIKAEDRLAAKELKLKDAKERIREFLQTEKARNVFYRWLLEQRSKANIVYDSKLESIIK